MHAHDDADGPSPMPRLEAGLGFRLGRAHRVVRDGWEVRLRDLGITPAQAAALRAVCETPGAGLRELARHLHTDAMNFRRLVERLEQLGLATSTTDPAHRQRRVLHPTSRGVEVAHEVAAQSRAWNDHVARLLGEAEHARLLQGLADLDRLLSPEAVEPTDPPT